MSRKNTTPPPLELEHPVLTCSILRRSAIKLDGDGGGALTLDFADGQSDIINELNKHYRMVELQVTFIRVHT